MKAIVKPLSKVPSSEKINQAEYESLYSLYSSKKDLVRLDGKKAYICKLSHKFPVIRQKSAISGDGIEIEFSSKAVKRILEKDCKFRS